MTKEIVTDFSRAIKSKLALYPSIYVTCSAADKNGSTHGGWVEANKPLIDFIFAVRQVLIKNPSPQDKTWNVTECKDFGIIPLKILRDLKVIHYYAAFFAEHGQLGEAVYNYLTAFDMDAKNFDRLYNMDPTLEKARAVLENNYYGAFESEAHFVKNQLAEIEDVEAVDISNYQAIADSSFTKRCFSIALGGAVHIFDHISQW